VFPLERPIVFSKCQNVVSFRLKAGSDKNLGTQGNRIQNTWQTVLSARVQADIRTRGQTFHNCTVWV